MSVHLQSYAQILSCCVVERTRAIPSRLLWKNWSSSAFDYLVSQDEFALFSKFEIQEETAELSSYVSDARNCCKSSSLATVRAYGGFYYSPKQALTIESLLATLPAQGNVKNVALAALIEACSKCAAAPGHTAQPFGTSGKSGQYLLESWRKDIWHSVRVALDEIAALHARVRGKAKVGDATLLAKQLRQSDLVFIDPPYSGVQYSRFYHVLEAIATGIPADISGSGRYPAPTMRPQSDYSLKTKSYAAFTSLLNAVADAKSTAIITFPCGMASNGLSGSKMAEQAGERFAVERIDAAGHFSTLGGNAFTRGARHVSNELILVLVPR